MKTTNLELSKSLKEAGYPQEASHQWNTDTGELEYNLGRFANGSREIIIASPTADELLDLLPDVKYHHNNYYLTIGHGNDGIWQIDYRDVNDGQLNAWVGNNLADLAADAWMFLKKEGLL